MVDILCTKQAGAQLCQAQVKLEVVVTLELFQRLVAEI